MKDIFLQKFCLDYLGWIALRQNSLKQLFSLKPKPQGWQRALSAAVAFGTNT